MTLCTCHNCQRELLWLVKLWMVNYVPALGRRIISVPDISKTSSYNNISCRWVWNLCRRHSPGLPSFATKLSEIITPISAIIKRSYISYYQNMQGRRSKEPATPSEVSCCQPGCTEHWIITSSNHTSLQRYRFIADIGNMIIRKFCQLIAEKEIIFVQSKTWTYIVSTYHEGKVNASFCGTRLHWKSMASGLSYFVLL